MKLFIFSRLKFILYLSCIGLCLPLIAFSVQQPSRLFWLIDLFVHWQWYYLFFFIVSFVSLILFKHYRFIVLFPVCFIPFLTASSYLPNNISSDTSIINKNKITSKQLSIMSINIHLDNQETQPLMTLIQQYQPDIIVIHELNTTFSTKLTALTDYFALLHPKNDPFGIGILSKYPITLQQNEQQHAMQAIIQVQSLNQNANQEASLISLTAFHPMPPLSPTYHLQRDRQLQQFTIEGGSKNAIIIGDFNATIWSSAFRKLNHDYWQSAFKFSAPFKTWQSGILMLPIDQALFTRNVQIVDATVLNSVNSDHLPIIIKFIITQ